MTIITMLGVDPSLTHTGYAVAEVDTVTHRIVRVLHMGTVGTAPTKHKQVRRSSDDLARAREHAERLRSVIQEFKIKVGASEVPSGAQNARAALAFGIAIGVLASLTCPLIEVSPSEVKLATVGSKTADKEDMVRWAVELTADHDVQHEWPAGRENDWSIRLSNGKFVTKTAEHQADAIAAIQAALQTQQFRQLAGMLNSLI